MMRSVKLRVPDIVGRSGPHYEGRKDTTDATNWERLSSTYTPGYLIVSVTWVLILTRNAIITHIVACLRSHPAAGNNLIAYHR
ncbi:hypothetical protein BDW68DRAFT_168298 [Aspergillus falconensis]